MVSQLQAFQQIQDQLRKRRRGVPRKAEVTDMLKQLYDPSIEGDRYFYSQDENDLPIERIATIVNGEPTFCIMKPTNRLKPLDWFYEHKPEDYLGSTWPPKRVHDLLGTPAPTEYCVNCKDDTRPCLCSYKIWSAQLRDFTVACVAVRSVRNMGYGGFARTQVPAKTPLGEYTGYLVPRKVDVLPDEDQYHSSIIIGKFNGDYKGHVSTWVDSTNIGSTSRFFNHSCEPNAEIIESRCGMNHRILYVESMVNIKEGEEITIDYGEKWFAQPSQPCLCGTASCKNPPRSKKFAPNIKRKFASAEPRKKPRMGKRERIDADGLEELDLDEDTNLRAQKRRK